MGRNKKTERTKQWILPLAAGIMAVLALVVLVLAPRDADRGGGAKASGNAVAEPDGEGNLVIYADRLSPDQVSFIRISEDSRIELLARLGDDGTVKAALGTCQSCNGSPNAYYVQIEQYLRCNNCKLVFQLNILDSPGGGCHPISIDSEVILSQDESGIVIDRTALLEKYEYLFAKIADH